MKAVEWAIAWRYLRAKRAEGGVSTISWIAFIGIALGVFAMIATFSVREGFRAEYIRTILGNSGHGVIYPTTQIQTVNGSQLGFYDYENLKTAITAVEGITQATPMITGQVEISLGEAKTYVEVIGISGDDFRAIDTIANNPLSQGNIEEFQGYGVALGQGVAAQIGAQINDQVVIATFGEVQTAFGMMPRIDAFDVRYIYSSGNDYRDRATIYMPFEKAQEFFNMEALASVIEYQVERPDEIETYTDQLYEILGDFAYIRTWKERYSGPLTALRTEDNLMFILTSILVLVSTFTIVAGLIMLVKNKTADIGILRTMGFSKGAITRIFFYVGLILGIIGTITGVFLGIVFVVYFDAIFDFVNWIIGGGAETTYALQSVPDLEAKLTWGIVLRAVCMSMGLALIITYFPARNAAKLDPVEALHNG